MNDDIDMTFFFGGGMGKNQKGYNPPPPYTPLSAIANTKYQ